MKPIEVKIMLLRKGLTFVDMAKDLEAEMSASRRSIEVMIADLLYGRRWYPNLASKLKAKYDISVTCPPHLKSIRQQLKQAA